MVRVLLVLAEGFEEIEAVTVADLLRRADGVEVVLSSLEPHRSVSGAHGIQIEADRLLVDCVHEDFEMIVLPGGLPGSERLANSALLVERLKLQKAKGEWIAAICAAPALVLCAHDLLDPHTQVTAYPSYRDVIPFDRYLSQPVVVSGRFITSQAPGSAVPFALMLLECLKGSDVSSAVRQQIVF